MSLDEELDNIQKEAKESILNKKEFGFISKYYNKFLSSFKNKPSEENYINVALDSYLKDKKGLDSYSKYGDNVYDFAVSRYKQNALVRAYNHIVDYFNARSKLNERG